MYGGDQVENHIFRDLDRVEPCLECDRKKYFSSLTAN